MNYAVMIEILLEMLDAGRSTNVFKPVLANYNDVAPALEKSVTHYLYSESLKFLVNDFELFAILCYGILNSCLDMFCMHAKFIDA